MGDELDISAIELPDRIPAVAPPNPATVRPGMHIQPPPATDEEWLAWTRQSADIDITLRRVQRLFYVARNPYNDAAWRSLKYDLETALDQLSLRNDPMAAHQRSVICQYLKIPVPVIEVQPEPEPEPEPEPMALRRYEVIVSHGRTLRGERVLLRASRATMYPDTLALVDLPDDEETRLAVQAQWLRPVSLQEPEPA